MIKSGNLFADLPARLPAERIDELISFPHVRVERIVSTGQTSPPGFWYDQDDDEWVVVLKGSAELLFDGEAAPRRLGPGDHVAIPARARHRVVATDAAQPTVWLAVHCR